MFNACKESVRYEFFHIFKGKYFHISPKKAAFGSSVEAKSAANDEPVNSQVNSPYNLRYYILKDGI